MNEKNKYNLKYILSDSNLLRDIKTIASFLLAYAVAVVSNGLIDGFSPAALISVAVTLGAFGTFFAIRIITNEFTDRGMFDEETTNKDLQERIAKQRELSSHIKSSVAYDLLLEYNKDKIEVLKKQRYQDLKHKYETEIKRLESVIEHTKITRKLKWFNRVNRYYMSKLNARKRKVTKKLANLTMLNTDIRYTPITLNQLRVSSVEEKENKFNESRRFNITPQGEIRKKMAVSNFIKTFFFIGFQGAAIATVTSWVEFLIFLVLITLTLATTALTSYVGVRRYANFNFIGILDEKIEKLEWLIRETKQRPNPEEAKETKKEVPSPFEHSALGGV